IRRRHTRWPRDWSSDVCSSDLPDDGITKGELAEYYQLNAKRMLPHVRVRPLYLNRFHGGIQYNPIQQKRVPDSFPAWIDRATLRSEERRVGKECRARRWRER